MSKAKNAPQHLALDELSPKQLSRQLRTQSGGFLSERRAVLGCSLVAAGSMAVISLYQLGIIRHLPEPPLPYFNADKVDASEEAYGWLSTPDGPLGLLSYAATAVLAAVGGRDRASRHPWMALALAAKAGTDAAAAAKLTVDQWTHHRAFCSWCLLAAGATFTSLAYTLPEARAAVRTLRA